MQKRLRSLLNLWLIVGLCIFFSILATVIETATLLVTSQRADAVIVGVQYGTRYDPLSVQVQFRSERGASVISEAQGHPFYRYTKGQQVVVLYDPHKLERVELPEHLWFAIAVSCLTILLFSGPIIWIGLRKLRATRVTAPSSDN